MLLLLLILFVGIGILAFVEERLSPTVRNMLFVVMVTTMALVAGLRPYDFDRDYSSYVDLYRNGFDVTMEVTFMCIVTFVQTVYDDVVLMFVIYALLGMLFLYLAIRRLTDLWFYSLLIYVGTYYLLHEMNQIRVGVASGLFLVALPYLKGGTRMKYAALAMCAMLFHYSAGILLFLVGFSFSSMKRWQVFFYAAIIPFAYIIYLLHLDILIMIPIPYIEEKLKLYQTLQDLGEWDTINVFNLVLLVRIGMTYFILWKRTLIEQYTTYVNILLKIEIISIAAFVSLYTLPVLAFRISELLGVVEIILFPLLCYTVKPAYVGKLVVTLVAVTFLFINIFYNSIVIV